MFDYHMHSKVSFDGKSDAKDMAAAAKEMGLKSICFTDHIDYDPQNPEHNMAFDLGTYRDTYDHLEIPGLEICHGVEFGMLPDSGAIMHRDVSSYPFDFVIGSIHFVDGLDPYLTPFWENRTLEDAELSYFEQILKCVKVHDDFDVMGHITYISKTRANPNKRPIKMEWYQEVVDAFLKILADKGKGLEINTSGKDRCGVFLPDEQYLRRFRELGGEIVTVGSDAHETKRVGQYTQEACGLARDIFGYVCTFRDRKPVFHKI